MRPKDETDTKLQTGTFILSEKIDDTKTKKSEKEIKKEMKRLEKEKQEREKREKKAREKEKEREKQAKKGKVVCGACGGKCSGEVLRVTDKYFHTACFTCRACSASLARGGFFCKDGHYYCPQDYQRAFGTRCAACGQYVEGEVVSALGNTYHQKCFTCARCKRAFPSGEKVTYTGSEVICGGCAAPQRHTARAAASPASPTTPASPGSPGSPASPRSPGSPASPDRDDVDQRQPDPNDCAGCGQELSEGQALVALDRSA
ncbi:PREDICTED: actin-binding LIM protein 2-like isoform X1 [Papilio polytes]|uniref:actin-binding LIM protein 2-like isoform X1 n=1 Tax=Papilio polytes TaxID=76194 RepID=UPI0006764D25|nr:PREDICTED: actin-binding LIM protein 2-like isoform X1 [Papilio polytes]